jgi:hypothetical protein
MTEGNSRNLAGSSCRASERSSKFINPGAPVLKKPTNVGFFALGWK